MGAADANYFDHQNGVFTNFYPHESLPVPDHGRYRLHNEIEDCIVCDKCAKVCPVDCIDIEAVKSSEEIRKAADGSSIRLYAAKFDIDMAKCCYCGLCTSVCPTDSLTMTKTFDYSEFDIRNMIYEFSEMTETEADEKREDYNQYLEAKKAVKAATSEPTTSSPAKPKVMIPGMKAAATDAAPKPKILGAGALKPKIVIKPTESLHSSSTSALKPKIGGTKPVIKKEEETDEVKKPSPLKPVIKKPVGEPTKPSALKPVMKKPNEGEAKPTALKPVIKKVESTEDKPKPSALNPVIKKPSALKPVIKKAVTETDVLPAKPSALKPVIKKSTDSTSSEVKKPSALRPVIKPKPSNPDKE